MIYHKHNNCWLFEVSGYDMDHGKQKLGMGGHGPMEGDRQHPSRANMENKPNFQRFWANSEVWQEEQTQLNPIQPTLESGRVTMDLFVQSKANLKPILSPHGLIGEDFTGIWPVKSCSGLTRGRRRDSMFDSHDMVSKGL